MPLCHCVKDGRCVEQLSPHWNRNISSVCSLAVHAWKATHTHTPSRVCVIRRVSDGRSGHLLSPTQSCRGCLAFLEMVQMTFMRVCVRWKWVFWLVTVAVNFTAQGGEMPEEAEICVWFIAKLLLVFFKFITDVMQIQLLCGLYWFKIWTCISMNSLNWVWVLFCPQLSDEQQEEPDCDIQHLPHPAPTTLTSAWTHR